LLIVLISEVIQLVLVPIPCSSLETPFWFSEILWVLHEIMTQCLGNCGIIVSSGNLNWSSSLESFSVTWLGVSEVLSAFICLSGGEFLHVFERTGFVAELCDEGGNSWLCVYTRVFHCLDNVGVILVDGISSSWNHLLQLFGCEPRKGILTECRA